MVLYFIAYSIAETAFILSFIQTGSRGILKRADYEGRFTSVHSYELSYKANQQRIQKTIFLIL